MIEMGNHITNAEQELQNLRAECARLRKALEEAQAEARIYRRHVMDFLEKSMTAEERAELDQRLDDVLKTGGRPGRELLELIASLERE